MSNKSKLINKIQLLKENITDEEARKLINELTEMVETVATRYTESQKKAINKYRLKNKEKFNEYSRSLYNKYMEDPEYRAKRKERYRATYQKKKQELQNKKDLEKLEK